MKTALLVLLSLFLATAPLKADRSPAEEKVVLVLNALSANEDVHIGSMDMYKEALSLLEEMSLSPAVSASQRNAFAAIAKQHADLMEYLGEATSLKDFKARIAAVARTLPAQAHQASVEKNKNTKSAMTLSWRLTDELLRLVQ